MGQEACECMPNELLRGSARRVAALSVVAVTVIAAAIGVTIWRYEYALSRSDVAIDARADAALSETLDATFWHEREATHEYLNTASPEVAQEVDSQRQQFRRTADTLAKAEGTTEARLRAQAVAGNERFSALFDQAPDERGNYATEPGRGGSAADCRRAPGPETLDPAG